MTPLRKRIFQALVALLWLAVLAVALEVFARWREQTWDERGRALNPYADPETAARNQAVEDRYGEDAPPVGEDMRARATFAALSETERQDFVSRREELVVWCAPDGTVREIYLAPDEPGLAHIAGQLREGQPITALFEDDPVMLADARQALRTVTSDAVFVPREYPIPLPENPENVTQAFFWRFPAEDGGPEALAVFFRRSMWAVLWQAFRPNVSQNDSYVFQTNELGWRDGPVTLPKPPGVVRIVCMGGSTTAEGPTNALTYPKILEKKLRRHFDTDRIEVVNAGVFAITSQVEAARLPDYLALEPDLVVYYNFVNDLVDQMPLWLEPDWGENPRHALKYHLRRSRFFYRYANRWLLPGEDTLATLLDQAILHNLRTIQSALAEHGAEFAVCSFAHPDPAHLSTVERAYFDVLINNMYLTWGRVMDIASYAWVTSTFNRAVQAFCDETGATYVPVAETLTGGPELYADICHMTLHGIERKAQAVFEHLRPWVAERLAAVPATGDTSQ